MAIAASIRKSRRLSSASREETSTSASRPNAVPAMKAIFCATGSCLPSGWPHCLRSLAHWRTIFSEYLVAPTQIAGSDRRPVLSVPSAIFRPLPSPAITFSLGTNTSLNSVTEFSIPRRPMNSLRCRTVIPSASIGQMKAVIPPLAPSRLGTTAITTTTSAITPLVAHSLVPLIR